MTKLNMKMQILTIPLIGNYGGILQHYALAVTASNLNPCITLDGRESNRIKQIKRDTVVKLKCRIISFFLRFFALKFPIPLFEYEKISMNFFRLSTLEFSRSKTLSDIRTIVGSDQVWRRLYVQDEGGIAHYFLKNISQKARQQSIAYAASFGTDMWEGSPEETEECGRLLREFKAVSVREHSGVKICKEVFGVDAVQMPDPTLLLHTSDYEKIIDSEKTWLPERKYVAAYVLDETSGKTELLQECAVRLGLQLQHLMPHATAKKRRDRFPISVPQRLRLIRDCECFITDSFHGCVFAILFNKPFVCVGNNERGITRFCTLLDSFDLTPRLINLENTHNLLHVMNSAINWNRVNKKLETLRIKGVNFLSENMV